MFHVSGSQGDRKSLKVDVGAANRTQSGLALLVSDLGSFRQQESIFVVLNLFVLAILLLLHTLFSEHWGSPSPGLVAILTAAFAIEMGELIWLQGYKEPLRPQVILALTLLSVLLNIFLAFVLAELSHREDTQYFILMMVPILESAFRLPFLATLGVIALADFTNFFWVWHYVQHRPRLPVGEYFEAGTLALIYTLVGIVVWLLVNQLHHKELRLSQSLDQLERVKDRLLYEERLAAVGRLSSAIAHEIRNPVAIISSALSTAKRAGIQSSEREEMFEIAAKEADRLEKLTTDFLTYARPRGVERARAALSELLGYAVDVCRPRSMERGVTLTAVSGEISADLDAGQVQQALINLVMNAVEASPSGSNVTLSANRSRDGLVQIDVEDAAGPIPSDVTTRMFEPFFTTKANGTGLGLAIARNIARAHGGDLVLSANEPGAVRFSLTLPAAAAPGSGST